MEIRPYSPSQHSILEAWWIAHEWTPVSPDLLPTTGFIVWQGLQPLASGFLYLTDSKFAVLEWVLSSPKSDRMERGQALDLLLDSLIEAARKANKSCIFTTTIHPKLMERYVEKGFIKTDVNVTHFIGRI